MDSLDDVFREILLLDGKPSAFYRSENDLVQRFIHGRADGPIELDVRAA